MKQRREVVGRLDYARYQQGISAKLVCNLLNITTEEYESALYDTDTDSSLVYEALTTDKLTQAAMLLDLNPAWLAFGGWGQVG